MAKITVIIVFLNEGVEVENTLLSIREHSQESDVDILLINDASTDNYDYKSIARKYNAQYYVHTQRIGAAASRNEGVNLCKTNYFILLDAHMRIFQDDWVAILTNALERNRHAILCCQTRSLNKDGSLKENFAYNYGAYIDFNNFSVEWNTKDIFPAETEYPIPCVLGASYASEKSYWSYLRGTTGLKSYGFEEPLISIKSWLAGGSCVLLKNIVFGHIYRTLPEVPYQMIKKDFVYNRYFISTLLLGSKDYLASTFSDKEKRMVKKYLNDEIIKNNSVIQAQKKWYEKIFTRDIQYVLKMNDDFKNYNNESCYPDI